MPPSLNVRIDALVRDVAAFSGRIDRVAQTLPPDAPKRRDEYLPKVRPLFSYGERLQTRAESLQRALEGVDNLDPERLRAGKTAILQAMNGERTITQQTRLGRQGHSPLTISVTDARSGASAVTLRSTIGDMDVPNVRVVGSIPQPVANLVIDRLENVPQRVVELTDALGTRGTLFSGRLTDVWGYRSLRGKQPRGWPPGKTWDIVPGAGGERGFAANPSRELKGHGHSSTSLALHEYGHTVDYAFGEADQERVSAGRAWRDGAWREARTRLEDRPYLHNHSEEWFAESFARYTRSGQSMAALARWYPETYRFFRERFGAPQFSR